MAIESIPVHPTLITVDQSGGDGGYMKPPNNTSFEDVLHVYGREIAPFTREVTYNKYKPLYNAGDSADCLYVVTERDALIARNGENGKIVPMYRASSTGEVNVFGMESVNQQFHSGRIEQVCRNGSDANEYTTAAYVRPGTFVQQIKASPLKEILTAEIGGRVQPVLLPYVLDQYAHTVRRASQRFALQSHKTYRFSHLTERIAYFLLCESKQTGSETINLRHHELADMMETERPIISALLGTLKSEGALQLNGTITIVDPEILMKHASKLYEFLGDTNLI